MNTRRIAGLIAVFIVMNILSVAFAAHPPALQVPSATPTSTKLSAPCFFNWATRPAKELTTELQSALAARGLDNVSISAVGFGEDCIDSQTQQVVYFAAMDTEFTVGLMIDDLGDLDRIGNTLATVFDLINSSARANWPSTKLGRIQISVTSRTSGTRQALRLDSGTLPLGLKGTALALQLGADKWPPSTLDKARATINPGSTEIRALAFSPDSKVLAATHTDGRVTLWNTITAGNNGSITVGKRAVNAIAFSPDGTRFATGDDGGNVQLWNVQDWRLDRTLQANTSNVYGLRFNLNNTMLATISVNRSVRIWQLSSGDSRTMDASASKAGYGIAFHPNSKLLATGTFSGTVQVWDVENGKLEQELKAPDGLSPVVYDVTFSPDGSTLAAVTDQGTLLRWDIASGKALPILQIDGAGLRTVAFSPDGKWIATGAQNGRIQLWNAASGTPQLQLRAHRGGALCVVFSPDGKTLASSGADGLIQLWEMSLP